jgi:hypothetical protein
VVTSRRALADTIDIGMIFATGRLSSRISISSPASTRRNTSAV